MEITFYRKIANKVSDAVLSNHEYSEAEAKRIRYGLVCIFSDLYKFVLMLIIFSVFSLTLEFLLAFTAVLLLRPVLGGYHAKSEIVCIIVSFVTMLISVFIGKIDMIPKVIETALIFVLPVVGILIAPVRTKKLEERKRNYKILSGILTIAALLIDIFMVPGQIIIISVLIIYFLSIYQLLKNKIYGI